MDRSLRFGSISTITITLLLRFAFPRGSNVLHSPDQATAYELRSLNQAVCFVPLTKPLPISRELILRQSHNQRSLFLLLLGNSAWFLVSVLFHDLFHYFAISYLGVFGLVISNHFYFTRAKKEKRSSLSRDTIARHVAQVYP